MARVGGQAVGQVDHRAGAERAQRAPLGQARLGAQVGAHEVVAALRAAVEDGEPRGRGPPARR
jgi:hypothetical protein